MLMTQHMQHATLDAIRELERIQGLVVDGDVLCECAMTVQEHAMLQTIQASIDALANSLRLKLMQATR